MSNASFVAGPPVLRESLSDALLKNAMIQTFPLLKIHIVEGDDAESNFKLKLPKNLVAYIKSNFLTDDILIHTTPTPQFNIWNFEMITAFNIMSNLGVFQIDEWIVQSRENLENILTGTTMKFEPPSLTNFSKIEEILISLNLIESLKNNKIVKAVVKNLIDSDSMTFQTIIYRISIALYHAKRRSGISPFPELDDVGKNYLILTQSPIFKKYKNEFLPLTQLPIDVRPETSRLVLLFLISAYYIYLLIENN